MRYLVTATPRSALTQEVFAESADAAIELAVSHPNRWKSPEPSPGHDEENWSYAAAAVSGESKGK